MAEKKEKQMEVIRRITKVSINDKRVLIKYEVPNEAGVDSYTLECAEQPVPDFMAAFIDLTKHIPTWLNLPDDWDFAAKVSELIIKHDGEYFSAAFKVVKEITNCLNPLKLTTPIKWNKESEDDSPYEKECIMNDGVLIAIDTCLKHAGEYIKGTRQQGKLFDG